MRERQLAMKRFLIIFIFFLFTASITVSADETKESTETPSVDDYDFSDIQDILDNTFESSDINFREIVIDLVKGESDYSIKDVLKLIWDKAIEELNANRKAIIQVILIAVVAAFFTNFSSVFSNNQISETGFFITYMLLITILVASFSIVNKVAGEMVSTLLDFMRALVPAYFMAVAVSSGSATSLAFYEITLVLITVVNWAFLNLVIPAVNIYVVIMLVNSISKEDFLSKFADLLKTLIEWCLKTFLAVVLGINVIQSLILPMADSLKNSALHKAISVIPGVGSGANALTEILLGSGVLIKNGIGVAALIVIAVISLIPILKIAIFSIMYQGTAAIIQPISDKRVVNCVNCIGEGTKLLLRIVFTTTMLFVITIAIVCASTNASYFAN